MTVLIQLYLCALPTTPALHAKPTLIAPTSAERMSVSLELVTSARQQLNALKLNPSAIQLIMSAKDAPLIAIAPLTLDLRSASLMDPASIALTIPAALEQLLFATLTHVFLAHHLSPAHLLYYAKKLLENAYLV